VSTVRTLVIVAVLAAIGYGVHVTLHSQPPSDPPPGAVEAMVDGPPEIEMSAPEGIAPPVTNVGPGVGGVAPPFQPATPAQSRAPLDEAPPFGNSVAETPSAEPSAPSDAPRYETPASSTAQELSAPPDASDYAPPGAANRGMPAEAPAYDQASYGSDAPAADPLATAPSGGPSVVKNIHAKFQLEFEQASQLLEQGQLGEAHTILSRWYEEPTLTAEERDMLTELLDRVAGTVVYSRISILDPPYEVQPGDTLQQIAEYYDVPWQLLGKINGVVDPEKLEPGQKLKVVRGKFSAVIDVEDHLLTLWLNGRYAGRFPVGVGQDLTTPEGEFVVQNKVEDPTYYGPDRVISADDPNNPLGERWIDLGNQIGIHGTNDPASIGQNDSRGCVRLSPGDVEDVYDILSVGSKVIIRR